MDIYEKDVVKDEEKGDPEPTYDNTFVEVNSIEIKDNQTLFVGEYGDGFAFLKAVVFSELKQNRVLKTKFFTSDKINRENPKTLIAELYQIEDSGRYHLVLLTRQSFSDISYQYVINYLKEKTTFKFIATYQSKQIKE